MMTEPLEFQVLCRAVRGGGPGSMPLDRVDWPQVVQGAKRHRVSSLVLDGLGAWGEAVPADTMALLRQQALLNAHRALDQALEVGRLLEILALADIRALVLKGVALSQLLYGNVAVRGVGDMDILVSPADFWRAETLLRQQGYVPDGLPIRVDMQDSYLEHFKDLALVRPGTRHRVELHVKLLENTALMATEFDGWWQTRQVVRVGNAVDLPTLPPDVLRPYLLAHGAVHCWERLRWLLDFCRVAQWDPAAMMADARRLGLQPLADEALALSRRWLDWPHDPLVLTRLSQRRLDRIHRRFFAGAGWGRGGRLRRLADIAWHRWYNYTLKPDPAYRRQERRVALHSPLDWGMVRLPLWGYFLLRPVGWIYRRWTGHNTHG